MSWSLSVQDVEQGKLVDALEEARNGQAENSGGFRPDVVEQQDVVFAMAEDAVAKLDFHGKTVNCSASGHVQNEEKADAPNYVSLSIYEKPETA